MDAAAQLAKLSPRSASALNIMIADVARELGDVWHPSRRSDAAHVRQVKERYPELRIVPRASAENAEGFLEAGAEGVVVSFADEAQMREFAPRYR